MAHFAKISNDNEVLAVLYVNDSNVQNSEGVETESVGQAYLEQHNNWPADKWIQTSYNGNIRKNYAGIGFTWDAENQIFWPPQPYPSWTKDVTTGGWVSPVGAPPTLNDQEEVTYTYIWDENTQNWNKVPKAQVNS